MKTSYQYRAQVTRVIDGDTFEAKVDLGFQVSIYVTVRLYGVDTPESKGLTREAGLKAAARTRELIEGKEVFLLSRAIDRYGRSVATVTVGKDDLARVLLAEGLAVVRYITTEQANIAGLS